MICLQLTTVWNYTIFSLYIDRVYVYSNVTNIAVSELNDDIIKNKKVNIVNVQNGCTCECVYMQYCRVATVVVCLFHRYLSYRTRGIEERSAVVCSRSNTGAVTAQAIVKCDSFIYATKIYFSHQFYCDSITVIHVNLHVMPAVPVSVIQFEK